MEFPLLADLGNRVADEYGLVHQFPPELRDVYRNAFGVDLADYNGDDSWTLPMPARYVVDTDGGIRWASVSADYSRRPDPADTVHALRRLVEG